MEAATLFLVDDHPIVREGLVRLLEKEPDLRVCGEADTPQTALEGIAETHPDLVILDLNLNGQSGLDLIQQILTNCPGTRILVMSVYVEQFYAERALRAGARGYVMKHQPPQLVLEAIRRILSGHVFLSQEMATRMLSNMVGPGKGSPLAHLSDRELEIFQMIGEGLTHQEIAMRLSLSVKTVESHVARIKEKINAPNGRVLLQRAIEWVLRAQGTGRPL